VTPFIRLSKRRWSKHYESLIDAFSYRSLALIKIKRRQEVSHMPAELVMKKIISGICASTIAVGIIGSALSSVQAAPIHSTHTGVAKEQFQLAQFRRGDDQDQFERGRPDRNRFERRVERPRFERRGGWSYYNGHRGYREYRRGYRQYNGFWFPPAAFVAGALIGGAIANQPAVAAPPMYAPVRLSAAHVNWCENRWKSYRVSDNSYQPLSGPRQACVSPYGG
jgi:hypothetical protein